MHHDTLLIRQILMGDSQALEQLIRKYHRTVYTQVRYWVKNAEDAQEITQDVFLKAYQNLASLKQPEIFDVWLRQIARHECYNWLRRKQPDFQPLSPDMASDSTPPDDRMVQLETVEEIIQAIENLPKLERELLKSHYLENISYADLQETHGLSYKAITLRVLRAKRKIRNQIGDTFSNLQLTTEQKAMLSVALGISTLKGGQAMSHTPFDFRAPHAANKDRKFGYINKSGEMVIPPQFDRAMSFCEGLGRVGIGDKQGYIDETGKIVIPLQFAEAYPFREGLAGARIDEKFGYIDKTGAFVIQPQFDHVEPFFEGLAAVMAGEKWGYIDRTGKYVVEPQFDKVWSFNDGIAPVTKGDTHGYIDNTGELVYSWRMRK